MTKELESRIKIWLEMLQETLYQPIESIKFSCFFTGDQLPLKEAMQQETIPIQTGDRWGKEWEYGWFFAKISLGDWAKGKRIVMDLNIGGEGTLYLDGQPFGARRDDWILQKHHYICDNYITRNAKGNEEFTLVVESYAGHNLPVQRGESTSGPHFLKKEWIRPDESLSRREVGMNTVGIWREEAYHLFLEATALYEIWKNEPEDSLRRSELEIALKKFCVELDFELEEEEYQESVICTRALLKPYLSCKNSSTAPVFHGIGHAHIDLAWLWSVEETKRKCARTVAAQLRHMEEYPEYKMMISQPWLLEQLEILYPTLFEKMKEKIYAGQLIPEGGMWVEADTNIPSGESLIRQFIYGRRYFKEKMGINSTLVWLPDVFGYSGALPQIIKGCGMTHFTTHKIFWTYHGGEPFPYHYFDWKGIDGTKIPTFIHVEYSSSTNPETLIQRWKNRAQKQGIKRFLQPFGYGDGGGGATRDHIENCYLSKDLEGVPQVVFDDPNHFFSIIEKDGYDKNEYVGELYYQAHRGTYTSQAKTKLGNRKGEFILRETEMWCTLAYLKGYLDYPEEELEKAWKLLLFQQFHDILPGSSINKVYQKVEKDYEELQSICKKLIRFATEKLIEEEAKRNNTREITKGLDLEKRTYFNSLSWNRNVIILLPSHWQGAEYIDGTTLTLQETREGLLAQISIPPCASVTIQESNVSDHRGKRQEYRGVKGLGVSVEKNDDDVIIKNEKLCIRVDYNGCITSMIDQEFGREWVKGKCNEIKMYQDIPGHFEAWDLDSLYQDKPIKLLQKGKLFIEERGPNRGTIRIERMIENSLFTQWISLEAGNPVVAMKTKIQWKESHKVLKAVFPVDIVTHELISEIQYGSIARPNHRSRAYDQDRFEVCNHKWSALMENNRGFAVLNDSKYGIGCKEHSMELTLLKSSCYPDESADKGIQEFTYGCTFWNTTFDETDMIQRAYELNVTPTVICGTGIFQSLFTVSNHNVILDTVKKQEHGDGIIIRLYESKGGSADTFINFEIPFTNVYETDMVEEKRTEIPVLDKKIQLRFTPFEIKTILFK